MNIEMMLNFQILADIVLFLAVVSLVVVVTKGMKKRPRGLDPDSLSEFKKLIDESHSSAECLSQAIDEGRKSLKELSYTLEEREKNVRKLIERSERICNYGNQENEKIQQGDELSRKYDTVIKMARYGLSEKDIAGTLGIPEGEINLILGLDQKKIENA